MAVEARSRARQHGTLITRRDRAERSTYRRAGRLDEAARFWAEALGRPVDSGRPGSRDDYRMLSTPPDEPIVEIQRVDHESRDRRHV